jgi:hypothetical protein
MGVTLGLRGQKKVKEGDVVEVVLAGAVVGERGDKVESSDPSVNLTDILALTKGKMLNLPNAI